MIAALPGGWLEHIDRLVVQTGISKETAMSEIIEAVEAWTADPRRLAKRHLAERMPILATLEPSTADTLATARMSGFSPTERWAVLAESMHTGLSGDPYWPKLSQSLDQAAADGIDVQTLLPGLLAGSPLPDVHPARSLGFRLADAIPASHEAERARPGQPDVASHETLHASRQRDAAELARRSLAAPRSAPLRPRG